MTWHKITITATNDKKYYFCDGVRISLSKYKAIVSQCISKTPFKTISLLNGARIVFSIKVAGETK